MQLLASVVPCHVVRTVLALEEILKVQFVYLVAVFKCELFSHRILKFHMIFHVKRKFCNILGLFANRVLIKVRNSDENW